MEVRAEINYPKATAEEAFALTVDPDFRAEVCEATHALDWDVSVEEHEDVTASVTVRRTLPAEFPDFIKKFVGDTVDVVQTEQWGRPDSAGQRIADVEVLIKGQPAKLTGTVSLVVVGNGARQVISGDIKVSIPFVGKKIEQEVAKAILAAIRTEERCGVARFADTP